MALAVTYFIEGDTLVPDAPVSDVVLAKIAQAAARIHRSTDALDVSNLPVERFAIPFEDDLREGLAALETLTAQDSPASHALRDLLLPRRGEVLRHLERLRGLQQWARVHPTALVLCHTDMHGDNLVLDHHGKLHVIDWESPLLAPAEHDLMFYTDDRFDLFLDHYEQVRGSLSLDSQLFGFYFYRRNLEDLSAWLVRILYENAGEGQNEIDLAAVQNDSIGGWPQLEWRIKRVEDVLANRKRLSG